MASDAMRVLVVARSVAPYAPHGGLERAARLHIDCLRNEGCKVLLITAGAERASAGMNECDATLRVPWPMIGPRLPRSLFFGVQYFYWTFKVAVALKPLLSDFDVLHIHGAASGILRWIPRLRLERVVTSVNPHGLEEFGPLDARTMLVRPWLRYLCRVGAKRADVLIATDDGLVPYVRSMLSVPADRIRVIPNSIDTGVYVSRRRETQIIDRSCLRVCTVGRLTPNKGYDLLADALVLLVNIGAVQAVRWIHFGAGESEREIAARCISSKVYVSFISDAPDSDVILGLQASDVFVQPSRYEGSSLSTLEAMAVGTPVVATPVGGIPDKIVDGATGFLANEVSSDSLCEALVDLIECDSLDHVISDAKSIVRNRFDSTVASKSYIELYTGLVKRSRRVESRGK